MIKKIILLQPCAIFVRFLTFELKSVRRLGADCVSQADNENCRLWAKRLFYNAILPALAIATSVALWEILF